MTLNFQSCYFSECLVGVKVSLKNDAFLSQSVYEGIYLPSKEMNSKPSFELGNKGIWYNTYSNIWIIGDSEDRGSNVGFIHAFDDYNGLTDVRNEWKYWKDDWIPASKDISVRCYFPSEYNYFGTYTRAKCDSIEHIHYYSKVSSRQ